MRLSPAHALAALKTKRPTNQNTATHGLSAGAMHFLPLTLASMIPGGSPASLAEVRDRRIERDDAMRTRDESEARGRANPSAAQQLQRDEREMKAGSRASTRQAGMELAREKFQSARDAFRSALSQARSDGQPQPSGAATSSSPSAPALPAAATPTGDDAGANPAAMPGATKTIAPTAPSNPSPSDAPTPQQAPAANGPSATVASATAAAAIGPQSSTGTASAAAATVETSSPAVKGIGASGPAAATSAGSAGHDKLASQPGAHPGERPLRASDGASKPVVTGDAESAPPRENVDRILRVLRGQILRSKSTTVIRMDPPELGYLRLQLDLHKDVLRLRIQADSDAARQMLSSDLDALRHGLEAAGIRLEAVEIRPMTSVDGSTTQQPQMPAWQDAPAGSRREGSRESRPQVDRSSAAPVERFESVDAIDGMQGVAAKDSRVNLVV